MSRFIKQEVMTGDSDLFSLTLINQNIKTPDNRGKGQQQLRRSATPVLCGVTQ